MDPEWEAESLRLTLFSAASIKLGETVWTKITGEQEAETRQRLPNGGLLFAGPWRGNQLSISTTGNRVDIICSPVPPADPSSFVGFLVLGPWLTAAPMFFEATKSWIEAIDFSVMRIAFGATLLHSTESKEQAYAHLKMSIRSIQVQPDRMRDLTFRINWPKSSDSIPGLSINRITTWHALKLVSGNIDIGNSINIIPSQEQHAARLEIDNNTDYSWSKPIENSTIHALYNELYQLACRSATQGEEPC